MSDAALFEPVVEAQNLCQFFGEGEFRNQVLFDNSITIPSGQLVIMTGPSGSGKTTLLTLIGALRAVRHGSLRVLGKEMRDLENDALIAVRRKIGFIFQMHNLFESLTAVQNVMMATHLIGTPEAIGRQRALDILTRLGLGHRIDYKPASLSGGQRQRVAVARALVNRPKLILADEPTAALDKDSGQEVVSILKELCQSNGSSVLMVTHDNRVLAAADRIVNMIDGHIVSDTIVQETLDICELLRKVTLFSHYTVAELGGIADKFKRRPIAPGDVLIRQGDVGTEFFLLGAGLVEVRVTTNSVTTTVAELGRGAAFGERALLTGDVRNATITVRDPGIVYSLDKPAFEAAVKANPDFQTQVRQMMFHR